MALSSDSKYAALTAAAQTLEIACGGYGTVGIQLDGTWVGTVTFDGTVNHGTWQTLSVTPTNSTTAVTSATSTGLWIGSCAGLLAVRARVSAFTSGSIDARLQIVGTGGGSGSGGGGGGGDVNLTEVGGAAIALGQALMAASLPVVLASNQTAIPISGTVTATNASIGTVGSAAPASATEIGFVDASSGELRAMTTENLDGDTGAGSAPTTGFATLLPASGGPVWGGTATNPIVTNAVAPTATVTSVADTASSTTLLALNLLRRQATIFNNSTEILYVKLGTTASLTDFTVRMIANAYYELPQPVYTGRIDGIWANNSSGAALVTEIV